MLTARELLNTRFDQVFRGYNPSQVDAFIARLVGEYETLLQENKNLKKSTHETKAQVEAARESAAELEAVDAQMVQAQAQLADVEQRIKAAQLELKLISDEKAQLQQKLRVLLKELSDLVAQCEEPDVAAESLKEAVSGN